MIHFWISLYLLLHLDIINCLTVRIGQHALDEGIFHDLKHLEISGWTKVLPAFPSVVQRSWEYSNLSYSHLPVLKDYLNPKGR